MRDPQSLDPTAHPIAPPSPEPVALVGIGCRFPGGANDVESFWTLLVEGRSGVREVPPDRWNLDRYYHPDPAAIGSMVTKWGGFVENLDMFDARFWGISPREAMRMDPQQRWLLEVAWEAIEDAGIAPGRLRGRRIGVFVGIAGNDYGGVQLPSPDLVDAYTNSGYTLSIAANRISYMLDFRGPSVSVDTACSSSLVAVWMACQSIWSRECEAALAGGVNALITPHASIGFSKAAMVSPSGQCFAFDARANGYVRGEGAGAVYLKPLAAALADGDRIYAVIRAAVVNQDGHTSSMTVPSVEGQTAMLRAAYRQAGIAPASVVYAEAHGTGTPVGDPIEARALGRVLGDGRADGRPCLIGSVKTNIGHLEAGSGIAGLIKAALTVDRRFIPPTLNHVERNPQIPFDELRLDVVTRGQPLRAVDEHLPVVAVNSFGFGGTNAHVVLEAAPTPAAPTPAVGRRATRRRLLPISARDETALRRYVEGYRDFLAQTSEALSDVCAVAGARKEHHAHRLAVVGDTAAEVRARLTTWLRDGRATGVVSGRAGSSAAPVFVFTGQGAQWWAMGQQLLEREPAFRRTIDEIDARFSPLAGWSLRTEMTRAQADSRMHHTDVAQPAIFALQVGLLELWKLWGVRPGKVVGHSVGEVAAAYAAGIYSLDDAVTIVFHRSRLQHSTRGTGRMAAVALSAEEAGRAIRDEAGRIEIAGINSGQLVTLSGDVDALERVVSRLERAGVFVRWLRIEYAFHSRHMDPIADELIRVLRDLEPRPWTVPFVSTVTGTPLAGQRLGAEYWWENVRRPVLFGPAISALVRGSDQTFLEIGPHPALDSALNECLAEQGRAGGVFHSLRRDTDETDELLTSLAGLHVLGIPIDWREVNEGGDRVVRLPHYPWNRESFWQESKEAALIRLAPSAHPLLGLRRAAALPTWQFTLDLHRLSYLTDHRIWDSVVFPAAGYGEIGVALGRLLFPHEPHAVEDLEIRKALFVGESDPPAIQVVFDPEDKGFSVYSSADGTDTWELHAQGTLVRMAPSDPPPVDLRELRRPLGEHFAHEHYCHEFAIRGYQFGANFQAVQNIWRADGEALAEIEAPAMVAETLADYTFHPALLDACFQVFIAARIVNAEARPEDELFLPRAVRRIRLYRERPPARLWAHARLIAHSDDAMTADIRVYDDEGRHVADVLGFHVDRVKQTRSADDRDENYYRFEWAPRRLRGAAVSGSCEFPSSAEILAAVEAAVPDIVERYSLDAYHDQYVPEIKAAVARLVLAAFMDLGWNPALGDTVRLGSFVRALGIVEEHHRVTRVLLQDLVKERWLRAIGDDAWEVTRSPVTTDVAVTRQTLSARYPHAVAEIDLLHRVGTDLAAVLAGRVDPMTSIFPGGSQEPLERYYAEASAFPAHLELLRVAVARAIETLPPRRPLRVLEVGAGTGSVTRALLPILPADRTEYLFTDVSPAFMAAASKRFAAVPFLEYRTLDLEQDPEGQGIAAGGFDLIVASDVLHATVDVRQTLSRLRRCLADRGLLLFVELVTRDFGRDNVVFGLLKGWWRFRDTDVRRHSALLDRRQWQSLLAACDFRDVASIGYAPAAEHAVMMAFAPPTAPPPTLHAPEPSVARRYVLYADESGVAETLGERLRARGHRTVLVRRGKTPEPDAIPAEELAGVIHCWSLDHPTASGLDVEQLRAAQQSGALSAFRLLRALGDASTRVWFVTRNTQPVTANDRVENVASAPLIGVARVANSELGCRVSLIDLDDCSVVDAAAHLLDELTTTGDAEFEVAYRNGIRHALRLGRVRAAQLPRRTSNAVRADGTVAPYQLQVDGPGVLANLGLHETGRRDPGPNEVEVRVRAGGINFRDVMKALGTYPGRPQDLRWLGDDVSGVIERIGEHVRGLQPGDEVAGVAPYAFRSYAVTDGRMVFRKPAHLSFEQAAALPTVFLTAHHAIVDLARMQPGERILIHAAAGGVGQAAIQVARHLGLEIFATAGTLEKRQRLIDMGVRHVMSSRTLEFADRIMELTDGHGVDAVLNSLAGDFIPKGLSVLAPFGRFLEIGKVDIYRNAKIGLHGLRNNISYFVLDLTQHMQKPAVIARMFAELEARFSAGDYQPVPCTVFPVTQAADAFRFMAQGKHVGKNVLRFDVDPIPIASCTAEEQRFRADASYLITGGAGGFGLEIAKWMARCGARHLVLMSRSGPPDEAARLDIERLRATGVSVVDARADVTRSGDVRRVVEQIRAAGPALRGVVHAAMVLDDEWLTSLDEERFQRVLEPKMTGAWNLHVATESCPLELFLCLSSFSAVCGAPRQSNYNAGNVFLAALAHHRRAIGLPALTVDCGAILGTGFVERNARTAEYLDKIGFKPFRVEEALRALGDLLPVDAAQVVAARVNWRALSRLSPLVATSATYAAVTRAEQVAVGDGSLAARLRATGDADRAGLMEDFIVAQVAQVFGMAADKLDRTAPLTSLGLDSLMTVELVNRLDRELSLRVPVGQLLSGPSIQQLAQVMLRLLAPTLNADGASDSTTSPVSDLGTVSAAPGAGPVVPIRTGGDQLPLIVFHPVGGGVGIYAALVRHLPQDVPVYGIESRLMRGAEREFSSFDDMVKAYATAVRELTKPPYRLAGFSLGGYLAARVAEVLEAHGETVAVVTVIDWDARPKLTAEAQHDALLRLALSAYRFLEGEIGVLRPLPESQLRAELGPIVERVMRERPARSDLFFQWAIERGIIVSEHLQDWARQYLACFGQHCTMLAQGVSLPRFQAPLVVWRARDGFGSPVESWQHAGAIAIEHVIDGDHFAFLRPPGALSLAKQIDAVLRHGCAAAASALPTAR